MFCFEHYVIVTKFQSNTTHELTESISISKSCKQTVVLNFYAMNIV